jgi:hypothetical protein
MARHFQANSVGDIWRRAVLALSVAFDPTREVEDEDTVFQPRDARARAKPESRLGRPSEVVRPSREPLQ